MQTFKEVCEEANVRLHEVSWKPEFLGFVVDTSKEPANIALSPKWIEKLHRRRREVNTVRQGAVLIGSMFWRLFAREAPLSAYPQLLKGAATIASVAIASKWRWESEVDAAIKEIGQPFTLTQAKFSEDEALCVFWKLLDQRLALQNGVFVRDHSRSQVRSFGQSGHIFYHELRAALTALTCAATLGTSAILWTDNTAVLHAIRSRRSSNGIANSWIARFLCSIPRNFEFQVRHVDTKKNPADKFTRGWRGEIGKMWRTGWGKCTDVARGIFGGV